MQMWTKVNPQALLVGLQTGAAPTENSAKIPQKTKTVTTIQSINFTSEYLSTGNENTNSKIYVHPYVNYSSIYNSQDMKATLVSITR